MANSHLRTKGTSAIAEDAAWWAARGGPGLRSLGFDPLSWKKEVSYVLSYPRAMGKRALQQKRATVRTIRAALLTAEERERLRQVARYEGSPHHKKNPGDFKLTPPSAPRPEKTLCDEAGVSRRSEAERLLALAIERGLASEKTVADGLPKQLWVVDENGRVFEAMHGGSTPGSYHGYPIRRTDPLFTEVSKRWNGEA